MHLRTNLILCIIFISFVMLSCNEKEIKNKPIVQPTTIIKNSHNFWNYYTNYVRLTEDYTSLDTTLTPITKKKFLDLITTGKYFPLRLNSVDTNLYQLYPVSTPENIDIPTILYTMGTYALHHFKMEGKPLLGFDFTDIEGQKYNEETTKGKIVVFKCWFIQCVKCVEEMPSFNKLIDSTTIGGNIIYVSLAFDKKDDLKEFLKKKPLHCGTIASQRNYLRDDLDILSFPTYIVIGKNGIVSKVVGSYKELEVAVFNELKK